MAGLYIDTSALGRVLLGEPDAPAIVARLRKFDEHIANRLLRLELRRLALREGLLDQANKLLAGVALLPLDEPVLEAAERVEPDNVGSLDAIHLVSAIRLAEDGFIDAVMTYDRRLAKGLRTHGISVVAPG